MTEFDTHVYGGHTEKIRIPNERLWKIAQTQGGSAIDKWLRDNVGIGGWTEYFGLATLPHRSFSFK